MKQHAEKEILVPTTLCDKKGNLNPEAIGYARKPIIDCNLSGHFMRKKKWNYWCVYGEDILFSATISHLDYAAVCFVYFLEYETQRYFEKTVLIPIGTKVKIVAGPFNGMYGTISSVDMENQKLELNVDLFGQETSVEVEMSQIEVA